MLQIRKWRSIMLFPKHRVKFTTSYQGKTDPEGWIVLDLVGADVEGATKIYLPMGELNTLKSKGDQTTDKLKQARLLLGFEPEDF